MRLKGVEAIAPEQGIEIFTQLLNSQFRIQNSGDAQVGVFPIEWSQFLQQSINSPFFADFMPAVDCCAKPLELLEQVKATKVSDRRHLLERHLCAQIAQVLGFKPDEIDPQKGFFDLGMDSLTSVELRNRLQTSLGCSLPTTIAFDYPNVVALVDYLAQEVLELEFSASVEQQPKKSTFIDEHSTALAELSQDEVADLLAEELREIGQGKQL